MTTSATASGEQARCPSRMLITDLQALKEILDNEDDERAIAIEHGLELSSRDRDFCALGRFGPRVARPNRVAPLPPIPPDV